MHRCHFGERKVTEGYNNAIPIRHRSPGRRHTGTRAGGEAWVPGQDPSDSFPSSAPPGDGEGGRTGDPSARADNYAVWICNYFSGGRSVTTIVHRRVESARSGHNPTVICRVRSGWIVLGDNQILPGYSLLLPDPVVGDLNSLEGDERDRFCRDMIGLGDALLDATDAYRINYVVAGNLDPALHAHVTPRYLRERAGHSSAPKGEERQEAQNDGRLSWTAV